MRTQNLQAMKTKITLFLGAVALVTLSFTFSTVENKSHKHVESSQNASVSSPVGGLMADQVVK